MEQCELYYVYHQNVQVTTCNIWVCALLVMCLVRKQLKSTKIASRKKTTVNVVANSGYDSFVMCWKGSINVFIYAIGCFVSVVANQRAFYVPTSDVDPCSGYSRQLHGVVNVCPHLWRNGLVTNILVNAFMIDIHSSWPVLLLRCRVVPPLLSIGLFSTHHLGCMGYEVSTKLSTI